MKDYESIAGSLYDGGWRVDDKDELQRDYELTEDEAEEICKYLEKFEA